MRTDSPQHGRSRRCARRRDVIATRYGLRYVVAKGRCYAAKSKGAQEAHEAIRPTSFARDPDSLDAALSPEQLRLYRLIWQRALASQMADKELETTTVDLAADPYELRASATRTDLRRLRRGLHGGL